jgi:hypothetical protein
VDQSCHFLHNDTPEHSYWFHCYGHPIAAIFVNHNSTRSFWTRRSSAGAGQSRALIISIRYWSTTVLSGTVMLSRSRLLQDEYNHSELLDEWFTAWGIDVIYSVCYEHRGVFYPKSSARTETLRGPTGFIDDADIRLAEKFAKPLIGRPIDVGYRAKKLPPQFGRFGMVKSAIGEQFLKRMEGRPLRIDISLRPEDAIYGNEWLRFLANCRFTLGCVRKGYRRSCMSNFTN